MLEADLVALQVAGTSPPVDRSTRLAEGATRSDASAPHDAGEASRGSVAWSELDAGGTPMEERPDLAAEIGLRRLWLKREDLNPTGSHKDRGVGLQVAVLMADAARPKALLISSSGNAAISASYYAARCDLPLIAFLSPLTAAAKVRPLLEGGALVLTSYQALTLSAKVADALELPNLRPSTDPVAPVGFQTLGWEILDEAPDAEAVFTFVSSATSLVGIGRAFGRARLVGDVRQSPALHAVQGTGAHPVAGEFDARPTTSVRGKVGALGARKTRRVGEAKRVVRHGGGSGWVITDDEAEAAAARLSAHGVDSSLEGAASLAAAARGAAELGIAKAVVVISGRRREKQPSAATLPSVVVETIDEAVAAIDEYLGDWIGSADGVDNGPIVPST